MRHAIEDQLGPMNISSLDHLVLTVRDMEATLHFYCDVMGMKKEVFGPGRIALRFGSQKINLHEAGREVPPHADRPVPGSADLCLLTDMPIDEAMEYVRGKGIGIIEGPVERTGATGPVLSFYVRDPDRNLIEISRALYGH